jgi:hypothetical protein
MVENHFVQCLHKASLGFCQNISQKKIRFMNNERKELLNLLRLPARLNTVETAVYLGFKPHDIPILVARGLLKPLGRPSQNSEKYFARSKLVDAENNEDWLSRATTVLAQHWRDKNARKSQRELSAGSVAAGNC